MSFDFCDRKQKTDFDEPAILGIIKMLKSCCEWGQRMPDDICGLDASRLQLKEKMQHICKRTSLLVKFQNIGLEVVL